MTEKGLALCAPAKVNLTLRVLGKRQDGYHEVETLMAPLDLADEVVLVRRREGEPVLECDSGDVPRDEGNLAVRALRLLEAKCGCELGLSIRLRKRIPVGAGLGGGSSDAAAVLVGGNQLGRLGLGARDLEALAAGLGADVSFFLAGRPCWCRGRGERVAPADVGGGLDLVLLKPAFPVATAEAYAAWEGAVEIPGVDYGPCVYPWGELVNDLERPVFGKHLHLAQLRTWLERRPEVSGARLSGSGSTVFGILAEGATSAVALGREAREQFGESLWVHCCRTLEASGLQDQNS